MNTTDTSSDPLELETYEQSQHNLRRLKENLPQELVTSLANEVLLRISERGRQFEHVPHEPSPQELEALCKALISDDETAAADIIVSVRAKGAPAEAIYLKHLAAAARLLGEWWSESRVSFVEVTIGTSRMFAIMRGMKHLFVPNSLSPDKSAIFASVPGETHTLGVRMAADFFRKDGWEITLLLGLDHDALVNEIKNSGDRIVGLSVGGSHSIDALSRLVVAIHICCPHTPIIVSGQDVESIMPLLSLMGVDGIASDIDEARQKMTELWDKSQPV